MSKLNAYPEVRMEQYENYSKGSYRNRCHIAGPNGLLRLSIPLKKGKNEQMPIREVRIVDDEPWQKRHWSTIRTAYGNAPFFEFYADEIAPLFEKKTAFLFDFNMEALQIILTIIPIEVCMNFTMKYQQTPITEHVDFRNGISPKEKQRKLDPHFQAEKYAQVFEEKNGFLPNLSILDLLFCTGPQAAIILENCFVE